MLEIPALWRQMQKDCLISRSAWTVQLFKTCAETNKSGTGYTKQLRALLLGEDLALILGPTWWLTATCHCSSTGSGTHMCTGMHASKALLHLRLIS